MRSVFWRFAAALLGCICTRADLGDPQLGTDHPWYGGELRCSTFPRLFAEQASQYTRTTGSQPAGDEQQALASWLWRNTHYAHGEEGTEDLWGRGFTEGDLRTREYWTGLFSHGFGLCGTTHSQWTAEMEYLLGHGRGRGVGVAGHNSFEVWLQGGNYGPGKWALLDHDLSTVIYDLSGGELLSIPEVMRDWKNLTDRKYRPQKQHGWLVCGLHPEDGSVYQQFNTAEYLAGYAGVPPMVHLRRGETLRRYLQPGLEDGRTFVFWGRNYRTGGIPGPERSITWVNQPAAIYGSRAGAGYHEGQARFGNALFVYEPDFTSPDYREGLVDESENRLTFEFYSPYLIAATPPNNDPWGIYDPGCRNGLVITGRADCAVSISVDQGVTWFESGSLTNVLDLTDRAKGHRQYLLRLGAGAKQLRNSGLQIRTVCQANPAVIPRLHDHETVVEYANFGHAVISAGPNLKQAAAHLVSGKFGDSALTLALATPRGEPIAQIYAAAHLASGNPPSPEVKYEIEYSLDAGRTWLPIVRDWAIPRTGEEPKDFWSQSFCYGSTSIDAEAQKVQIRFRNDGKRPILRAEAHLVYRTGTNDAARVTFGWTENGTPHEASRLFATPGKWALDTGTSVETRWVEIKNEARSR